MKTNLTVALFLFLMASPWQVAAAVHRPGAGVEVTPARATWNTGYFQEVLVRKGLEVLGYTVKNPVELQNPLFYQAVYLGDVDYWTNGWFPMHNEQMPKNFYERGEIVGYVSKAGGLQGYLVSKKEVERFGILSLDDFKRPEVKQAFDQDGDGRADLVACPPGWGCENTISHHLDVYELNEHINPIKAGYTASMADALARYKSGEPVFFYTWAPNWTIAKFKPGEDVMWINVPEIRARPVEMEAEDRMTMSGIDGAVSDPIKLGFVVADIRIVGNRQFLDENPAIRRFFEVFSLPLADINAQNAKMHAGEKSAEDINRHAESWIEANRQTWKNWLGEARRAAQ
ncbi:MAG TPA: glycine betaine/L-proline ABC transporter substrate-binding protein ProX [Desulfuromonadales bacterium]|nr:glycine betaine/L-proline ABC transporter substrate-binding protein ProX [Desulfuromonadales bacterium]